MSDADPPCDVCRPVVVDGQVVQVLGDEPLTEAGVAALAEVVRAAHRMIDAQPAERRAEMARRQAEGLARIRRMR